MIEVSLPHKIGEKITFIVPNSPLRHGIIIDIATIIENNRLFIIGYKVKCKNKSIRVVEFKNIKEE